MCTCMRLKSANLKSAIQQQISEFYFKHVFNNCKKGKAYINVK